MKKIFRESLVQYNQIFSEKQFTLVWSYLSNQLATIDWEKNTKKHIQEKLYAQFNAINEELFLEEWDRVVNNGWSEKAYDLLPTNIKKLFENKLIQFKPIAPNFVISSLKLIRHDKRDSYLEHTFVKNNEKEHVWSFVYFLDIKITDKNKITFADINKSVPIQSNSLFLIEDHYLLDYIIEHHGDDYLYYIKGVIWN